MDKKMDFIYVNDLYKILCFYLSDIKIPIPNHFDCVYSKKYYLSEIAEMIKTIKNIMVVTLAANPN